ncbi:MAG: hypothetical protein IPP17_25570 [Bacteroidetes bacterium]|nr:hypothetical protein [Bacteroidota bacterium]
MAGPIYAETPTNVADGQWLLEPWNAISSLLIVAPAIYFLIRLRGRYGANLFLTPASYTDRGRIGHHFSTDSDKCFLLWLDVLPTMILFLAVSVYFWAKVFRSWWAAAGVMLIAFAATYLVFECICRQSTHEYRLRTGWNGLSSISGDHPFPHEFPLCKFVLPPSQPLVRHWLAGFTATKW